MKRPKLRKSSKRMSCSKKYKIERKVKEHNRKARKEAKKKGKGPKRKDPGVPNDAPFKEEILREAELRKQRMEEQKARQKEERKKLLDARRGLKVEAKDLETFQKGILKRQRDFERKEVLVDDVTLRSLKEKNENSRRAYYKELKKVVESADVILEVLDARDPLGCRCSEMEQTVISAGSNKRVVLVLNKIDLIPKENVEAWLKYLRKEFPTVAFKASTQAQSQNLSQNRIPIRQINKELMSNSSKCLGADNLLKLLGNYCRNAGIKTSITVGVVGYPNVGKSSIINSLKRAKACNVGSTPGVTRSVQPVIIDKNIKILDCPGIVMASGTEATKVLRNCVRLESIEDPIEPVDAILRRCDKQQMIMHYNIGNYDTTQEFLSLLARRRGKLRKGGIPDVRKTAKLVLADWNRGKICYYTHPPEAESHTHISSEIVTKMAAEFDLDSLESGNNATLGAVKGNPSLSGGVLFKSLGPTAMEEDGEKEADDEDEPEEMEEGDCSDLTSKITIKARRGKECKTEELVDKKEKSAIRHLPSENELQTSGINIQANKGLKDLMKRNKKKKKRANVLSEQLGESLLSAMDFDKADDNVEDEDYDFQSDFIMK